MYETNLYFCFHSSTQEKYKLNYWAANLGKFLILSVVKNHSLKDITLKQKAIKALKFLVFLIIGLVIFWLIYKDQDIERIKEILKNDVHYGWLWLSLMFGLLSHISPVN